MWLTGLADTGVIIIVSGQVFEGGSLTLENITLDIEELTRLDTVEQAQRIEAAQRQIDEVQRATCNDPYAMRWVHQQRQYLTEMQHLIFELA